MKEPHSISGTRLAICPDAREIARMVPMRYLLSCLSADMSGRLTENKSRCCRAANSLCLGGRKAEKGKSRRPPFNPRTGADAIGPQPRTGAQPQLARRSV
jgi:hypothetical protein